MSEAGGIDLLVIYNSGRYRMAGDWRIYLEAMATPSARIAYVADPLNMHRRHAQSVTHALKAQQHVDEIAALVIRQDEIDEIEGPGLRVRRLSGVECEEDLIELTVCRPAKIADREDAAHESLDLARCRRHGQSRHVTSGGGGS